LDKHKHLVYSSDTTLPPPLPQLNRNIMVNLWSTTEHALGYLAKADSIPHRTEGEAVLLDYIPKTAQRILDLGTGDGRLMALLKIVGEASPSENRPSATGIALDFSPVMLEKAKARFQDDRSIEIISHNLDDRLPDLGQFNAIVSSFAIHHVTHDRKRSLYEEIFNLLTPGGVFANLEHVASPNQNIHVQFLTKIGYTPKNEDPSNKLLDVETQLGYLREIGFDDVDCYWKWLELALLIGIKPN
jgi:tRNA (cmo5U34)-methyltransferase